jgi:hypothetical protein
MVTVGLLVACALQAVVDQMADLTARAPFTEDRVAHSWAPCLSCWHRRQVIEEEAAKAASADDWPVNWTMEALSRTVEIKAFWMFASVKVAGSGKRVRMWFWNPAWKSCRRP